MSESLKAKRAIESILTDKVKESLELSIGALSALQFLKLVLFADELVDLVDEVRLGLGDNSLNLVNLLIDDLVDLLHMVEHLVSFLVELVKL